MDRWGHVSYSFREIIHFIKDVSSRKKMLLMIPVLTLFTGFIFQRIVTSSSELHLFASLQEQPALISTAETTMRALAAAYPGRIGSPQMRDGDWAFLVNGRWFYYAESRFLPEEHRSRAEEYRAQNFNWNYPAELPPWESTAEQRAARTQRLEENRNRPPSQAQPGRQALRRPMYFAEALWNISNRNEAWEQQAHIEFLGHQLSIHSDLSHKMKLMEEIILNEARTNAAVRQWVNSLGTIAGWNWRTVASSGNRSSHSYGIAIDLLPGNLRGQETYWLWASRSNSQWWNIPYSSRYHPPDEVVRTFESFGFVWGGKWANFDTMHFEYRPEVFILSNIPMANFPR